ncbi:MAG: DNA repair protein RecO [Muribaculaceae bacterium]|nr:DNA repair protein RecO [Alistipes senegalensis]MCM1473643.1 DNA repair protein RecO [Muribaculaceae bacterium]
MNTIRGIVLKERTTGDNGKFIDILTAEKGIIELTVRGGRKINSSLLNSTQLFAYSDFCYHESSKYKVLTSAVPVRIFYKLRESLSGISLACYMAEVLKFCSEPQGNDILRLFLNILHFLENNLREEKMLKAIFEFRLMAETGFMPDVVMCRECGAYEPEELYFSIRESCFCCTECFKLNPEEWYKINISVLSAMRHILLTDFERLFNFRTSENTMNTLAWISEKYLTAKLERGFKTLDFYKSIKQPI